MNADLHPPAPSAQHDLKQDNLPLVVDLDGTLCRTDTLQEAALGLIAQKPAALLALPGWIAKGPKELKARIADQCVIPAENLPLNADVIALVEAARAEGRETALVSAADHRQVTAVAEATGLFDMVQGSTGETNLKGTEKARFLTGRYGEKGFDYVGDAKADLPVWQTARKAITVGASASLRQAADMVNAESQHIAPAVSRTSSMLAALRPHQWSKNLLLFLPLLAAHKLWEFGPVLVGFVAFCLTASAVYIINDLLDLAADRAHPRKRSRPFAAGALTALEGTLMAAGLLATAALLGALTGSGVFMLIMGVYFVATLTYSLWIKRKLIADVLMLAGLYSIRIIAGGAVATVDLSPWMLGFSMFLFLALAAVKRQSELADLLATGRDGVGRAYATEDLPVIRGVAITSGQAAVLVLALYISSDDVQRLYAAPSLLWLICPLLLYWVLRMVMKTHRGQMVDDPIVFAATDKISVGVIATAVLIGVAAAVWPWATIQV